MTTINDCLQIAEEMACAATLEDYKAARGRLKRALEEQKTGADCVAFERKAAISECLHGALQILSRDKADLSAARGCIHNALYFL